MRIGTLTKRRRTGFYRNVRKRSPCAGKTAKECRAPTCRMTRVGARRYCRKSLNTSAMNSTAHADRFKFWGSNKFLV